jgi:hypothetical protein
VLTSFMSYTTMLSTDRCMLRGLLNGSPHLQYPQRDAHVYLLLGDELIVIGIKNASDRQ